MEQTLEQLIEEFQTKHLESAPVRELFKFDFGYDATDEQLKEFLIRLKALEALGITLTEKHNEYKAAETAWMNYYKEFGAYFRKK